MQVLEVVCVFPPLFSQVTSIQVQHIHSVEIQTLTSQPRTGLSKLGTTQQLLSDSRLIVKQNTATFEASKHLHP